MPKVKTALVDADVLFYKMAYRHEEKIQWSEDVTSTTHDAEGARLSLDNFVESLLDQTGCDRALMCMTHAMNFRLDILPTYKHNRKDKKKPELHRILKSHVLDKYECKVKPWLEADDLLGILGSRYPDKYIICTIDKDLETVPCTLFNWNKDKKPRRNTEQKANENFYRQSLIGDPVDGFTGLPGCGPVKAARVLDEVDLADEVEVWAAIVNAFADKGYDEEYALQQARMARILRYTDFDFERNEVIYWQPPK